LRSAASVAAISSGVALSLRLRTSICSISARDCAPLRTGRSTASLRSAAVSRSTSAVASRTAAVFGLTAAGFALCAEAVSAAAAQATAATAAGTNDFHAQILFDITNPSLL
jgi:hypothetical protein